MLLEDLKGSGISLWKTNLAMRRDDAMMSTNPPNTTPTPIPTAADVVVCVGSELGLVVVIVLGLPDFVEELIVVVVVVVLLVASVVVVESVKNDSLFPGDK